MADRNSLLALISKELTRPKKKMLFGKPKSENDKEEGAGMTGAAPAHVQ